MFIIKLYLTKEIYKTITATILLFLSIITFFSFLDDLNLINIDVTIIKLLYIHILEIPSILYEIIPIGVLIGTTLSIAKLTRNNEILILKTSGISTIKLFIVICIIIIPIALSTIILSELIIPITEIKHKEEKIKIRKQNNKYNIHNNYWFKEETTKNIIRYINIRNISTKNLVNYIYIYEFNSNLQIQKIIFAEKAHILTKNILLENVTANIITPPNNLEQKNDCQHNKYIIKEAYDKLIIETSLTPEIIIANVIKPEHASINSLLKYIQYMKKNKMHTERQSIALWKKITNTINLFIMISIATHISFLQYRKNDYKLKILIRIIMGIIILIIHQITINIGILNRISTWIIVLTPSFIFFIISIYLLILKEKKI
ncbi:lipopolysaccharide export system permease protein [Candidatus Kinetoplastibacterium desouzaii TCC079E]|uniref:Lipopolysaccharide export system permease protein n=1 Tax=Candidatus Kinetoplastidibacterium desouzai TCC079E TaxID=1208919 RepID=M1M4N9_9PROT|nr:LptF/LptG family permease [Candidatus Kinetoplastibacterium desouzaii]AGF47170.1 lipopolysaccharide export system permease protein [Candidatus Kinetoplastibacterium desouzaii TCC079E]